jgi:hypothetical protein
LKTVLDAHLGAESVRKESEIKNQDRHGGNVSRSNAAEHQRTVALCGFAEQMRSGSSSAWECRLQAEKPSGRKRRAAAAALAGVRVYEDEPLLHEGFLVIQSHAVQIDVRLGIDEDAHIFVLEYAVALSRLSIETDVVT